MSSGNIATVDVLRAVPFLVARNCTVDQLSIMVNVVLGAGTRAVLGIYSSKASGYPDARLGATAPVVVDVGAVQKNEAVNIALTAGSLYWIVQTWGGGAAGGNVHTQTREETLGALLLGLETVSGTSNWVALNVARAYDGTLPAAFPAGATRTTNNDHALVCARFSA